MPRFPPGFLVLAAARTISILGSDIARFGVPVWLFESGGGATVVGLATAAGFLPQVLLGPFVGVLIDRVDKRRLLVTCDILLSVVSLLLAATASFGYSERTLAPILLLLAAAGTLSSVQHPTLQSAVALLNTPADMSRANGVLSIAESSGGLLSPLLGVGLLSLFGVRGVLLVDAASFLASALLTALVAFPAAGARAAAASWLAEARQAWAFIASDALLSRVMILNCATNFLLSFAVVLVTPLVLTVFPGNRELLAVMLSLTAVASLGGAFAASLWRFGSPVAVLVRGTMAMGLAGLAAAGLSTGPIGWTAAFCFVYASLPVVNAHNRALWQLRVPAGLQGRVFALRRSLTLSLAPVGYAASGILAEKVLEAWLAPPPGRGFRMCLVLAGAAMAASALVVGRGRLKDA